MTWAERLLRLAGGDPKRAIVDHLRTIQQRAVDQAERLSAAAAQAPTAGAEGELRTLTAEASALAADLTRALDGRGPASQPGQPPPALNGATRNHWARLVAALEACRETRAQLLRTTPRLLELDGSLAALLEAWLHRLDTELVALRALIARADPQALD